MARGTGAKSVRVSSEPLPGMTGIQWSRVTQTQEASRSWVTDPGRTW